MPEILKPIDGPLPSTSGRGKYTAIWEGVSKLTEGQWLPVKCADVAERRLIQGNCGHRKIESKIDGLILYLRKKSHA